LDRHSEIEHPIIQKQRDQKANRLAIAKHYSLLIKNELTSLYCSILLSSRTKANSISVFMFVFLFILDNE